MNIFKILNIKGVKKVSHALFIDHRNDVYPTSHPLRAGKQCFLAGGPADSRDQIETALVNYMLFC